MRNVNIKDCTAMIRYWSWLENELKKENHGHTEFTVMKKYHEFKEKGDLYWGESTNKVSTHHTNGGTIQYRPDETTSLPVTNKAMYLID